MLSRSERASVLLDHRRRYVVRIAKGRGTAWPRVGTPPAAGSSVSHGVIRTRAGPSACVVLITAGLDDHRRDGGGSQRSLDLTPDVRLRSLGARPGGRLWQTGPCGGSSRSRRRCRGPCPTGKRRCWADKGYRLRSGGRCRRSRRCWRVGHRRTLTTYGVDLQMPSAPRELVPLGPSSLHSTASPSDAQAVSGRYYTPMLLFRPLVYLVFLCQSFD